MSKKNDMYGEIYMCKKRIDGIEKREVAFLQEKIDLSTKNDERLKNLVKSVYRLTQIVEVQGERIDLISERIGIINKRLDLL